MYLLNFFFKTALLLSLSISIFSEDDNKAKEEDKEELKTFLEELTPYPGLLETYRNNDNGKVYLLLKKEQLDKKKRSGDIGGCYIIESKKGFMLPYREFTPINERAQTKIEQLFTNSDAVKRLSKNELLAIKSKRLTIKEIKELRAIRKATEVFEK